MIPCPYNVTSPSHGVPSLEQDGGMFRGVEIHLQENIIKTYFLVSTMHGFQILNRIRIVTLSNI